MKKSYVRIIAVLVATVMVLWLMWPQVHSAAVRGLVAAGRYKAAESLIDAMAAKTPQQQWDKMWLQLELLLASGRSSEAKELLFSLLMEWEDELNSRLTTRQGELLNAYALEMLEQGLGSLALVLWQAADQANIRPSVPEELYPQLARAIIAFPDMPDFSHLSHPIIQMATYYHQAQQNAIALGLVGGVPATYSPLPGVADWLRKTEWDEFRDFAYDLADVVEALELLALWDREGYQAVREQVLQASPGVLRLLLAAPQATEIPGQDLQHLWELHQGSAFFAVIDLHLHMFTKQVPPQWYRVEAVSRLPMPGATDLQWSGDGAWLAVATTSGVHYVATDGSDDIITVEPGEVHWAPQGQQHIYIPAGQGQQEKRVYLVDAPGGAGKILALTDDILSVTWWDWQHLLVLRQRDDAGELLFYDLNSDSLFPAEDLGFSRYTSLNLSLSRDNTRVSVVGLDGSEEAVVQYPVALAPTVYNLRENERIVLRSSARLVDRYWLLERAGAKDLSLPYGIRPVGWVTEKMLLVSYPARSVGQHHLLVDVESGDCYVVDVHDWVVPGPGNGLLASWQGEILVISRVVPATGETGP